MHDTGDNLTPEERAAIETLPRERMPSRLLEERAVRALRARGLLRSPRFRGGWVAAALAASLAFFASGFALGQWATSRSAANSMLAAQQQTAMQAARTVQQTGSAYVTALAALTQLADNDGDAPALAQGREVALAALYAAAMEIAALAPDDPVAGIIRHELTRVTDGRPSNALARRLVWF